MSVLDGGLFCFNVIVADAKIEKKTCTNKSTGKIYSYYLQRVIVYVPSRSLETAIILSEPSPLPIGKKYLIAVSDSCLKSFGDNLPRLRFKKNLEGKIDGMFLILNYEHCEHFSFIAERKIENTKDLIVRRKLRELGVSTCPCQI